MDINQSILNLSEINSRYELPTDKLVLIANNFENQRVSIPIVGMFSSGKSSLLNKLLGSSLLPVNITPETATPTELIYCDRAEKESVTVIVSGEERQMSLAEYRNYVKIPENLSKASLIKIKYSNDFLQSISDIKLVDMPGFSSGQPVHDMAIDSYINESMAYVIAFPADDMTLKQDLLDFITELRKLEQPVYVVITKTEMVSSEDLDAGIDKLRSDFIRYFGISELRICKTSVTNDDTKEFKNSLTDLQKNNAQQLIETKFKRELFCVAANTEKYLSGLIKDNELSVSELEEKAETLQHDIQNLKTVLEREMRDFLGKIPGYVIEINNDLKSALNSETDSLVTMLAYGTYEEAKSRIKNIVRLTITDSIQKRFVSKLKEYAVKLDSKIGEFDSFDLNIPSFSKDGKGNVLSFLTGMLGAGSIGGALLAPATILLGPITLVVGVITSIFGGAAAAQRKEEEKKRNMETQIRNNLLAKVFPEILGNSSVEVEKWINETVQAYNIAKTDEVNERIGVLEKTLSDANAEKLAEEGNKKRDRESINADLTKVSGIISGCN